jgi:hypothetical protein
LTIKVSRLPAHTPIELRQLINSLNLAVIPVRACALHFRFEDCPENKTVVAARRRQQERFAGKRNVTCNARMGTRDLKAFCALDETTLELLKMAMNESSSLTHCTMTRGLRSVAAFQ